MISRRHFLQLGARSVAALGGGASLLHLSRMNALAQGQSDYRALVCVFLFGGNDGNNTIVPMSTTAFQAYAKARSVMGLNQSSLLPIVTPAQTTYGLHPRLVGMRKLFQQQRLAVAANVGVLVRPTLRQEYQSSSAPIPSNLYSHMDQQIAWQTAVPVGHGTTGWGGRAADVLGGNGGIYPVSISVAGNAVFGTGSESIAATIMPGMPAGLANPENSAGSAARLQSFGDLLALDSGSVLVRTASETTREGVRQSNVLNAALRARPPAATVFPNTSLGQQFAEIAKVINVRQELGVSRQIFFCSLGGFDTHDAQIAQQDAALAQLDQAVMAFYNATLEMGVGEQVTTFTQSEFGRTLQPTSGGGTDHAWGNHHLIVGGAVRGGDIYGAFPILALGGPDDVGKRGVWLPSTSLDQYGATLASWLGVNAANMPAIFPNINNFATTNLGFLNA
jgi:uncharacterized protein (DUF1501 family)